MCRRVSSVFKQLIDVPRTKLRRAREKDSSSFPCLLPCIVVEPHSERVVSPGAVFSKCTQHDRRQLGWGVCPGLPGFALCEQFTTTLFLEEPVSLLRRLVRQHVRLHISSFESN